MNVQGGYTYKGAVYSKEITQELETTSQGFLLCVQEEEVVGAKV